MFNKKGFTMIELLVVLVIIAILAAVATPLYLANTQRAKASDAVATMGLIRQAMRDYHVNTNIYYNINPAYGTAAGTLQNPLPTSVNAAQVPTPVTSGVAVDKAVAQYFSDGAFLVEAGDPSATPAVVPAWDGGISAAHDPVGFVIKVNGSKSEACTSATDTNCALKNGEITNFRLNMDDSGQIYVSYDGGTSWGAY